MLLEFLSKLLIWTLMLVECIGNYNLSVTDQLRNFSNVTHLTFHVLSKSPLNYSGPKTVNGYMWYKILAVLITCLLARNVAISQTCCSGGVPMSGNLGLPVSEAGSWQFSLSYDLNVLNTLKDGKTVLDDNTRKRTTHSILAEVGYSLNDRWSIDGFFSFVRQERKLTPIGQAENFNASSGLGDAVILLKYRLYKNFQIGIGSKVPLGPSDLKSSRGLTLNADLQPGSGAWDVIYWLGGSHPFNFRKSMSINTTLIYRATGQNNTYFGNQTYEFGNEFQALIGIADRFVVGSSVVDPGISIKYRSVSADNNDGFDVPSTGGRWLFIRPSIAYSIVPEISIQSNIELPLFAELEGTQVTPTYRFNLGVLILFPNKKHRNDLFQK